MTKTLNTDVLKRTESLLSQIDTALRASSAAERVSRVIESAAPAVNHPTYPTVDDWLVHADYVDAVTAGTHDDHDYEYETTTNVCGCAYLEYEVTAINVNGDRFTYESVRQECELDEDNEAETPDRIEIEELNPRPWWSNHRIADVPCGAEGCACEVLFARCVWCDVPISEDLYDNGAPSGIWVDETDGDACDDSHNGTHMRYLP